MRVTACLMRSKRLSFGCSGAGSGDSGSAGRLPKREEKTMLGLVYRLRRGLVRAPLTDSGLVTGAGDEKQINNQDRDQNQCAKNDVQGPESEHPPLPWRVRRWDVSFGMMVPVIEFGHDSPAKIPGKRSYRNPRRESSLQRPAVLSGWRWDDCPAVGESSCDLCL